MKRGSLLTMVFTILFSPVSSLVKRGRCGFLLIFATSLCFAVTQCPDPRFRQVSIGGDTIEGAISLQKGPLLFALYFSSGKTAWVGSTDKNGRFTTKKIPPGTYRLFVPSWGSATIQLNPDLAKKFSQKPAWSVFLSDNACISYGVVMN
jgi:hypothetical protein